jgi:hypothetical protein
MKDLGWMALKVFSILAVLFAVYLGAYLLLRWLTH